jgi:signal transduction histidine kinase
MMSIRLRFTLLYTLILAVTLTIFGFALYFIQSTDTLRSIEQDLTLSANRLAEAALRAETRPLPSEPFPPSPIPFDQFSSDQAFQTFPEREIRRILDLDGNLIASPFGREKDVLPLSAEGLQTLQGKQEWWSTEIVSDEKMLIYSRPVIVNDQVMYIVQVARSLTERDRTLQSLATTLLAAGFVVIVIAFGIGWVLSGFTLRPIHRITQTAQKIGDERDFKQRVDYTGPTDEVGQLANTFNSMLGRLQEAYHQVEHSLQMQRDFVADVSHELRTPLTTLRGNLGLLRHAPPPDEQADILNDMVDESDRLIRLVNDLLQLARADAGRSLAKETINVTSMLEETCRQVLLLDPKRSINLKAAGNLNVAGDRDAIKQVMLIVLDNAVRHSNGNVELTARRNGAEVKIKVQDHGEGIPTEELEHVFDRFYRGDDSKTLPGFGLGLSIAKSLMEAMNGSISLTSAPKEGTTVRIAFPAALDS